MLMIGTLHLPSLSLVVCFWSLFYFTLRHVEPQRKAEWHCRLVTLVHASLISLLTGWSTFVQGPWPFTDAGGPSTPLQVTATTICVGYFLFDFAWCLYFQTEGMPMLLHHFLSIFGMFFMLVSGKYGTEMVATICGSEVTNPLLQLRWFLKETGRYHTLTGEVVDFLFMMSFFLIRLGLGSILLYCYFQQPTDFWGRLGAICIYLISWMFWVSIFRYAVYKYSKKYRARPSARSAQSSSQDQLIQDEEDESHDNLKAGESDWKSKSSKQLLSKKENCHPESSGKSSSSSVSQNGVVHRNNGGQAFFKGAASMNGFTSEKGLEPREL